MPVLAHRLCLFILFKYSLIHRKGGNPLWFSLFFFLFFPCCKSIHFEHRVDIFLTLFAGSNKRKISHLVRYRSGEEEEPEPSGVWTASIVILESSVSAVRLLLSRRYLCRAWTFFKRGEETNEPLRVI